MSTTYRAAYLAATQASTSGGWVLTLPEHADLSDADLMAEARKGLAEYNDNCNADNGVEPATEADIIIGDWTE
jgi:hypothetical protein